MSEEIQFLSPVSPPFVLALIVAVVIAYLAVRWSGGQASQLSSRWPIYMLRGALLLTLLALLFNPVVVTEEKGAIEPAQIFFMLDASESMALGNENATRWDEAVQRIQAATKTAFEMAAAEVSLFRFGRRLQAIASPHNLGLTDAIAKDGLGVSFVEKSGHATSTPEGPETTNFQRREQPEEPDTQLFVALRQISSRFGRKPPSAVVVFSDGRARDSSRVDQAAQAFAKLQVPIYTVPVGSTDSGGDIAIVSLVLPSSARKQSEIQAQAFLRSYGFDGKRVELKLNAIDRENRPQKRLATVPVTLQSGFQSVPITFRTDSETQRLRAIVTAQPDEVSQDNNSFDSEIVISREKIRVLYIEGSHMRAVPTSRSGRLVFEGPGSNLQKALQEDVDIECVVVHVSANPLTPSGSPLGAFPKSVAELSSFDAIVLSDVPRRTFSEQQLEWIEKWVRKRGGGLCMVGGRNSFVSGQWKGSPIESVLPVQLGNLDDWRSDVKVAIAPDTNESAHPFFRFVADETLNRDIVNKFPGFQGANVGLLPKPNLSNVVAASRPSTIETGPAEPLVEDEQNQRSGLFFGRGIRDVIMGFSNDGTPLTATEDPSSPESSGNPLPGEYSAITVGQYGRGRTVAMTMPITGVPAEEFLNWGRPEHQGQYYAAFWRNVAYWLSEWSYVGRRRLVARADKRYYGPGETITLVASAFDESANETSRYRLVGVIEPQSFDNIESDFSIVRWPSNVPREEATDNPFAIWGEEFEIPIKKVAGKELYQLELPLAETLPSGTANQSLRLELTAYEDYTQVDSTSVPIQILHDPFEQQNPFPDHELLKTLAEKSGGRVLPGEDDLADVLKSLPIQHGPSEMRRTPAWSNWWALVPIIGLIGSEWCYRRWIGLA